MTRESRNKEWETRNCESLKGRISKGHISKNEYPQTGTSIKGGIAVLFFGDRNYGWYVGFVGLERVKKSERHVASGKGVVMWKVYSSVRRVY